MRSEAHFKLLNYVMCNVCTVMNYYLFSRVVCVDNYNHVWYSVEKSVQCYKVIYKDLNYADNFIE